METHVTLPPVPLPALTVDTPEVVVLAGRLGVDPLDLIEALRLLLELATDAHGAANWLARTFKPDVARRAILDHLRQVLHAAERI